MCAHALARGDHGRFLTSTFNRGMARNSRLRASFSALLQSRARRLGTVKIHRDHILHRAQATHHHRCPGAWAYTASTIFISPSATCARGVQAIKRGVNIYNELLFYFSEFSTLAQTPSLRQWRRVITCFFLRLLAAICRLVCIQRFLTPATADGQQRSTRAAARYQAGRTGR